MKENILFTVAICAIALLIVGTIVVSQRETGTQGTSGKKQMSSINKSL
ncbi:MAG: hypothetical protein ACOCXQ_03640 [Patescibacteria group bacterium]